MKMGMDMPAMHMDMSSHQTYVKFRTSAKLLVSEWSTDSIYGLILAMVAAVMVALSFECIHEYYKYLYNRARSKPGSERCGGRTFTCCEKLVQTVLVVIRIILGYFLMMCVMTMNVWLILCVILGATLGYGLGKPLMAMALIQPDKAGNRASYGVSGAASRSRSWRFRDFPEQEAQLLEVRPSKARTDARAAFDFRFSEGEPKLVKLPPDKRPGEPTTGSRVSGSENTGGAERPAQTDPEVTLRKASSNTSPPTSPSRFKSTSRVISHSLQRERKGSERSQESPMSQRSLSRFRSTSKVIVDERLSSKVH